MLKIEKKKILIVTNGSCKERKIQQEMIIEAMTKNAIKNDKTFKLHPLLLLRSFATMNNITRKEIRSIANNKKPII